jgi:hypothetical protein
MSELSDALLEAHVRHELAAWQGEQLEPHVTALVSRLFDWLAELRLEQLATPAQVVGIIDRYVIDLPISAGIIELAGEVSQTIFHSPIAGHTRLDELLGDEAYEGFAQTVAHLERVRRELLALIARSEATELAHARLLARTLRDLLFDAGMTRTSLRRILVALETRLTTLLAERLARRRKALTDLREQRLLELLDPELIRSIADEIWLSVARVPLGQLFQFITKQDLEDFVVLGFEFWKRYRKTAYFRGISAEVVALVFRKYGAQSVSALIEDMGVSQAMITRELLELLGPLVAQAARPGGFLEQSIRARLAPFYRSPELLAIVEHAAIRR